MELVAGPTLAERLESGSLPSDESSSPARQIAEALEEAHEKGIVYLELSPDGRFLTIVRGFRFASRDIPLDGTRASRIADNPW